jgi:very-short-patch-repair endonuclease
LHLSPVLLQHAREMRREAASTEQKLWRCLRGQQLGGFKFRRQQVLERFIADFYCAAAKLVVETDGDSHAGREVYDASRTKRLERDGVHVIRFANDDVHRFLDAVLLEILYECERLTPSPLEGEGGGEG